MRSAPDILVVGAAKAGIASLQAYLILLRHKLGSD
jgi:hypothetical protein